MHHHDDGNNHEKVELAIRQAINACSYDSVFSETKSYLYLALSALTKVAKKRNRHNATQKAVEEANKKAKETQQKWWEMLRKNASNNFNIELD